MNRRLLAFCTTVLLAGLITACGNNASPSNAVSPAPSQTETATSTPAPSAVASPSASPQASPSEEVEPNAAPEPTEVEKTYRMNKNYFIVPIDKEKTESKVVLLTFDDGPKDHATLDPILDTLDKHKAKAIFFVNGYRVKANPDLLTAIDERDQIIGNHSWDHISLKKEKAPKIKEQIESVQAIVKEVTGKTPIFFRPPHGASNDAVRQISKDNGLLFMTWSNGSLDWDMNKIPENKRPQAVIDNVLEQLHPGSNILMHELPWTAETLDNLLTQLEQKGYSFVDPNAIDTEL
ncbi:polysaccharide deacetylase family protein [Cohnella cholangitidis]|uniref:Polysaccharide deacetylase family protein n=1 Tax=Cohnella cholangitidis TaxID=2598458 RepID=A0A7G5C565_9BACL|nr:polysaccharide deacetylase family protein [Cohnella cholangitidis]QMV44349.1 polysaccharide deacetylase family protein [Cohnella cholangitidis]